MGRYSKGNYEERSTELVNKVYGKLLENSTLDEFIDDIEISSTRIRLYHTDILRTEEQSSWKNRDYDGNVNVVARHGYANYQQDRYYERKKSIFEKVDDIAKDVAKHAKQVYRKKQSDINQSNMSDNMDDFFVNVLGAEEQEHWTTDEWKPTGRFGTRVKGKAYEKSMVLKMEFDIRYYQEDRTEEKDQKVKELLMEIAEKYDELDDLLDH